MINIELAIAQACCSQSKLSDDVLSISGMSSKKVRHLLNNIGQQTKSHLEIGSWKGSTLISTAYGTDCEIYAMDNFSQFNDQDILGILTHNLNWLVPNRNIQFVNADFHSILSIPDFHPKNIESYFFDGDHSEQSQYDGIVCVESVLADEFVLLVDDWNHEPTRKGTIRALTDLSFQTKENYYLPASHNGDTNEWWNGLWIARIVK